MNLPGGHQQSLMPATSRSSPAFEPLKAEGTTVLVGSSTGVTGSTRWQPSTPDASRTSEQSRLAKDMTRSPQHATQACTERRHRQGNSSRCATVSDHARRYGACLRDAAASSYTPRSNVS